MRLRNENSMPEEWVIGWPKSLLATHAEVRAARGAHLEPGDKMEMVGQYPPCPSCKASLNKAVADSKDASGECARIIYEWNDGGVLKTWEARGK